MPSTQVTIAFEEARRAAQAAIDAAASRGNQIAVVLLDASGDLVAGLRMDGVSRVALEAAAGKARTAVAFRTSSATLTGMAEHAPGMGLSVSALGGMMLMRGGLPILVGGACVGAIGVAGGGADEDDARAGIAAVFGEEVASSALAAPGPHGGRREAVAG